MNTRKTAALAAATMILAATAIPAAHAAAPAPDAAATADGIPRVVLRYSAADVATERGARDLYQRIATAALQVCPTAIEGDLQGMTRVRQCQAAAVSRAVGQVHEQRLVEIAAAHTRRG